MNLIDFLIINKDLILQKMNHPRAHLIDENNIVDHNYLVEAQKQFEDFKVNEDTTFEKNNDLAMQAFKRPTTQKTFILPNRHKYHLIISPITQGITHNGLCTIYHFSSGPIICATGGFLGYSDNTKNFIIGHEDGHAVNGHLNLIRNIDDEQMKKLRKQCDPDTIKLELEADRHAARLFGKDVALNGLYHLRNDSPFMINGDEKEMDIRENALNLL